MTQAKTERKVSPVVRAGLAIATFLTITGVAFVAMTEAGIGLLEAFAGSRHSAAFGLATVIYTPMLVIFFVAGIIIGLWASHRSYFGPRRWSLGRAILFLLLSIMGLFAGGFALLSFALPKNNQPPLAYGVYGSWQDMTKAFAQRLKVRFPVGLPEEALISELRTEQFKVDPNSREAFFDADGFPCRITWYVHWQADNGHVIAVTGSGPKIPTCL